VLTHVDSQKELLKESQGHIYPGGKLVYSTCSLEKEENQGIIDAFLKEHDDWKVVIPDLPGENPGVLKGDFGLTFLPTDDHDGGFLAILQKL
jgi:16S rRNA (cytosine967-C5)-methyltransferase